MPRPTTGVIASEAAKSTPPSTSHPGPDQLRVALVDELIERHLAREDELLGGLSAAERTRLADLLGTLLSSLEERGRPV